MAMAWIGIGGSRSRAGYLYAVEDGDNAYFGGNA